VSAAPTSDETAAAREAMAPYLAGIKRIADEAPPLPDDAVALLRATGFPVMRSASTATPPASSTQD
jgi:hypothetical protein